MKQVCEGPYCNNEYEKAVHNQKYCSQECKRDAEKTRSRREFVEDVVEIVSKTSAPAFYENDFNSDNQVEFLRKEVGRLGRLAEKHKANTSEIVNGVYQAAWDVFSQTNHPPVPKTYTPKMGPGGEEVAVAVIADTQLGKVTETYNSEVAMDRMIRYADKVMRITDMQRSDHPVNHLRVWMLGDIVEGEDIFPGQAYQIDTSLFAQVGVTGPEMFMRMIDMWLGYFDSIHLTCVIGNHGRLSRRDFNPETNMDRLLYRILELIYRDNPRVTFDIPSGIGEKNFWAVDRIGNYSTLLVHGDQFPPPNSNHTYYKKVLGWKDGAIPVDFNDVFMGHYHHNVKMTLGSTVLRVAGSPESSNTYAQELLGVMTRPSQPLMYIHPENGVTAEYTLFLDD